MAMWPQGRKHVVIGRSKHTTYSPSCAVFEASETQFKSTQFTPLELGVSWSLEMATAAMRSCGHPDVCPSDFVHADNILTHSENGSGLKTIRSSLWVSCAGPAQLMHKSRQELMDPMQSHDS